MFIAIVKAAFVCDCMCSSSPSPCLSTPFISWCGGGGGSGAGVGWAGWGSSGGGLEERGTVIRERESASQQALSVLYSSKETAFDSLPL